MPPLKTRLFIYLAMIDNVISHAVFFFQFVNCASFGGYNTKQWMVPETINSNLGVPFRHKLNDQNSKIQGNVDLLAKNGSKLPDNSWVKLQWSNNEIYGLPLEGNQGSSTFLIKRKTPEGESFQELSFFVHEMQQEFFHEVKLCTSLNDETFLNNLDKRYSLVKTLAEYMLDTNVQNIKVKDFKKSCLRFSFLHVDDGKNCNREKMKQLSNKFHPEVDQKLLSKLSEIVTVFNVNLTLAGECLNPSVGKSPFKWLKSATPFLLLSAIVFIPVGISCYVCRAVKSRKNALRLLSDKKLREEQAAIAEEIKRFTEFCKLHEDNVESEQELFTPKWDYSTQKNKKTFIENILGQYTPYSKESTYNQNSSISPNNNSDENKLTSAKSLNPISRYFRISTPAVKKREQDLLQAKKLKRQASIRSNMNDMQLKQPTQQKKLPTQYLTVQSFAKRASLQDTSESHLLKVEDEKYKKSVSFNELSDLTQKEFKNTSSQSAYRKTSKCFDAMPSTFSCSAVDKIDSKCDKCVGTSQEITVNRRKSILTNSVSSFLLSKAILSASKSGLHSPPPSTEKNVSFPPFPKLEEKKTNCLLTNENEQNDEYQEMKTESIPIFPILTKKQRFISSLKNIAFVGRKKISQSVRETFIAKQKHDAATNTLVVDNENPYAGTPINLYCDVQETAVKCDNPETLPFVSICCTSPTNCFDIIHVKDNEAKIFESKSNLIVNKPFPYLSEKELGKISLNNSEKNNEAQFICNQNKPCYNISNYSFNQIWDEKINQNNLRENFKSSSNCILSQDRKEHHDKQRFSLQNNQRSTSESALTKNERSKDKSFNKTCYQRPLAENLLKRNCNVDEFGWPRHRTSKSILTSTNPYPRFDYDTLENEIRDFSPTQDADYQFVSSNYNSSSVHDSESSDPSYSSTCTPISSDTPIPYYHKQFAQRTLSAKDRRDLFRMQRSRMYRNTKNASPVIYEDSIVGDINSWSSTVLPSCGDKNKFLLRKGSWQKYHHKYESRSSESIGTLGTYLDLGSEYELKADALPLYEKEYARSSSTSWNNETFVKSGEREIFENYKLTRTSPTLVPGKLNTFFQPKMYKSRPKNNSILITNTEQSEFV